MGRHTYVTRTLPWLHLCHLYVCTRAAEEDRELASPFASSDWHQDNMRTNRPTAFGQLAEHQWPWPWGDAYKRRPIPKSCSDCRPRQKGAWLIGPLDVGEETRSCNHLHGSEQTKSLQSFSAPEHL
ncbi:hypothetical protein M440DRAFT_134589 [Trichoderma longibrachiatum ATCC 18648]|uniref:Secreted protein n=1 Tax=Trichoderma longibrachiatum ATCC 18648 TaxID=983965 RepID=A0A2T4BWA0_TRILO|nr:hypothetical protein M440DRAFT_134589 [Trichoderma longibrachiatum ATCC 18648]